MKKTLQLAFLCLFLNVSVAHAQGELPVNQYTGSSTDPSAAFLFCPKLHQMVMS